MKTFLLEILTLATIAMMALPFARMPNSDKDSFAHLDAVGTFGM